MQPLSANRTEDFFGSGNTHRAVSAGLVLLLHLIILAALLYARAKTHVISEPRETILTLLPLLRHELPAQAPPHNARTTPKTKQQTPPVPTDRYQNISPPIQTAPDATVLGPALNGCDLESALAGVRVPRGSAAVRCFATAIPTPMQGLRSRCTRGRALDTAVPDRR